METAIGFAIFIGVCVVVYFVISMVETTTDRAVDGAIGFVSSALKQRRELNETYFLSLPDHPGAHEIEQSVCAAIATPGAISGANFEYVDSDMGVIVQATDNGNKFLWIAQIVTSLSQELSDGTSRAGAALSFHEIATGARSALAERSRKEFTTVVVTALQQFNPAVELEPIY